MNCFMHTYMHTVKLKKESRFQVSRDVHSIEDLTQEESSEIRRRVNIVDSQWPHSKPSDQMILKDNRSPQHEVVQQAEKAGVQSIE